MVKRPVDLMEERAWLDGYRVGDMQALERVFRAYGPLVMHVLQGGARGGGNRLFIEDEVEQDDVAQEVFIRLFSESTRKRYDGIHPFSSLVYRVARCTLIDHLRKRSRLKEDLHEDLEENVLSRWVPGEPLPDESVLTREEQQAAAQLWECLDPEEQRVAAVRYEQGLSQRDAAEVLGLTRQNIRTLETRVRRKMEEFVARIGWIPPGANPK